MSLQGAAALRARLKAIRTVFKPAGREWADHVILLAKPRIPIGSQTQGRPHTRDTVKRTTGTKLKTRVGAFYPVNFIDHGTKAHDVRPKRAKVLRFTVNGKPMFAKKARIPAKAARPFKKAVAREALAQTDILRDVVTLWNRAGKAVVSKGGGAEALR